jgi:hypothetical protein
MSREQEDIMRKPDRWGQNIRTIARTISIFVLAVIIVGISMTTVLAKGGDRHHGYGKHYRHGKYYVHRRHPGHNVYYHPVPVYPPPPVVYAPPPPPPGISVVFPITIR